MALGFTKSVTNYVNFKEKFLLFMVIKRLDSNQSWADGWTLICFILFIGDSDPWSSFGLKVLNGLARLVVNLIRLC